MKSIEFFPAEMAGQKFPSVCICCGEAAVGAGVITATYQRPGSKGWSGHSPIRIRGLLGVLAAFIQGVLVPVVVTIMDRLQEPAFLIPTPYCRTHFSAWRYDEDRRRGQRRLKLGLLGLAAIFFLGTLLSTPKYQPVGGTLCLASLLFAVAYNDVTRSARKGFEPPVAEATLYMVTIHGVHEAYAASMAELIRTIRARRPGALPPMPAAAHPSVPPAPPVQGPGPFQCQSEIPAPCIPTTTTAPGGEV